MTRYARRQSRLRQQVDGLIKDGYTHVVDADLQAYFDTIPHDRLVARVMEKVSDGRILDLVRGWLKADIMKGRTGGRQCRARRKAQ